MIQTGEEHPVVKLLAEHPEWEFILIGSRRYSKERPRRATDWDFLVDGSLDEPGKDGKKSYRRLERPISEWLEEHGFKQVMEGGYSIDSAVSHYCWRPSQERLGAPNPPPHVDVLITRYRGEVERRLRVFEVCSHRLMQALGRGSWADLFELIRKLEKTRDLRTAEEALGLQGVG